MQPFASGYFGSMVESYDSLIRRAVPRYDEMISTMLDYLPGKAERVHGIGASQKRHACAEHESDQLLVRSEEVAVELEFSGRPATEPKIVLWLPAMAYLAAHVGEAQVGGETAVI